MRVVKPRALMAASQMEKPDQLVPNGLPRYLGARFSRIYWTYRPRPQAEHQIGASGIERVPDANVKRQARTRHQGGQALHEFHAAT
jgi:hypothetical protein